MNVIHLIGNIGDDIKMHYFEGGGCVGTMPLATNYSYKKRDSDERISETTWHNLVFRGKVAEVIEKYTKKGQKLAVSGRIRMRSYDTEDGSKRYITEVIVNDFEFISSSNSSDQANENSLKETYSEESKPDQSSPAPDNDGDDDLPF